MLTNARSLVVGVFTDHLDAQRAVDALQSAGFAGDQIHFMARGGRKMEGDLPADQPDPRVTIDTVPPAPDIGSGRVSGSVGDVFGEAWAQLTGATASAANKLRDALVKMGVPEENADHYQDELEAGRAIVVVRATDHYEDAVGILRENGAMM